MRGVPGATCLLLLPVALVAQVAIEHVSVIDPRTRSVHRNQTVLVEGELIRQIGPASAAPITRGYRRIDGRGRYLIPGLHDCHVHLTKAGANTLPLFVANGVTSVRDMGSDPHEVLRWRREIETGVRAGPRIRTSGRILESKANVERMLRENTVEPVARIREPIADAEDVRKAVAELKRLGVDHLKVRTVPDPQTFAALADAARDAGLPLTGHPLTAPREYFGRLKSVEHLLAFPLLELSEAERRQLYRDMRDSGTWMGTTIVNFEGSILVPYERAKAIVEDVKGRVDPRRRYIAEGLLADWREQVEEREAATGYVDSAQKALPALLREVREMHEEGVRLLPGTDVGVALIYPGFDLHTELAIYVEQVGVSVMEALRAATHNPAEFYGEEKTLGGIAAGQAADLVLLDRNPLENIRNTTSIRAVIARGRVYDRKGLKDLLRRAAAH